MGWGPKAKAASAWGSVELEECLERRVRTELGGTDWARLMVFGFIVGNGWTKCLVGWLTGERQGCL